jgi:hypothetical protein
MNGPGPENGHNPDVARWTSISSPDRDALFDAAAAVSVVHQIVERLPTPNEFFRRFRVLSEHTRDLRYLAIAYTIAFLATRSRLAGAGTVGE